MEVFMRNIAYSVDHKDLTRELARILHGPDFVHSSIRINFRIFLLPDKRGLGSHRGCGKLTLPTEEVGNHFLALFGNLATRVLALGNRRIFFSLSKTPPRADVVEEILRMPYLDPQAVEARDRRVQEYLSNAVHVSKIQFGWECRDWTFSSEYEHVCSDSAHVQFEDEAREIRIKSNAAGRTHIAAVRFSQINYTSTAVEDGEAVIFLSLQVPPMFETETLVDPIMAMFQLFSPSLAPLRKRHASFDGDHAYCAAYTSLAIRLVCRSREDLSKFRTLCRTASISAPNDDVPQYSRQNLFTNSCLDTYRSWLTELPWPIAFQVDSLTFGRYLDVAETLQLQPDIARYLQQHGVEETGALLRHFAGEARDLGYSTNDAEDIQACFTRCVTDFKPPPPPKVDRMSDDNFLCYHVIVTPTSLALHGPFPERSNRVIRSYPEHADHFVRVSFVDENHLQYRFDRQVDGPDFIRRRVGQVLDGLDIAGTHLEFLAYSQSALKEHAVWFLKPFVNTDGQQIDAASIIYSLGTFHNLSFDANLGRCPARYGARISQAFTATDSSISVDAEEIFIVDDVERNGYCFTDGVGTISSELADAVRKGLYGRKRRRRRPLVMPPAFQVRLQGAKGMLSIDYKQKGRVICLRKSMIKFEAPDSHHIEIARAFDRPSRYFLNRPLIMLLEGLGVPFEAFEAFQNAAVQDVQSSAEAMGSAAFMLECHGLGGSFRLPSVMNNLSKRGFKSLDNRSYHRILEFSVHHILREMKHHARIPIPGGWTLVGVADVHHFLEPTEIFAALRCPDCHKDVYLEGETLVSRSPTIHPGDVQKLHAVGAPPPDSPFRHERLSGCIVFSVKGERPIPNYLGGGDLDGDTYNVWSPTFKCRCSSKWTHLEGASLLPPQTFPPGDYTAAEKKLVDHPCSMKDVANFFMDYINSDVLGIVGINWLIIADQSNQGIFDPDCLMLAQLHSDAVDYPKSGQPVPLNKIPRLKFRAKPDWNAPETLGRESDKFYNSNKAIGRLFRAIDLPAVQVAQSTGRRQRRAMQEGEDRTLEELVDEMCLSDPTTQDEVEQDVEAYLRQTDYISLHLALKDEVGKARDLFAAYKSQLRTICMSHTLSHGRNAMLTEEEVVVGTIVAKASQPRKRKDLMSKMRDVTAICVRDIRDELKGDDGASLEDWLRRAYVSWKLAIVEQESFGGKSFWWICLGAVFDAVNAIKEADAALDYA